MNLFIKIRLLIMAKTITMPSTSRYWFPNVKICFYLEELTVVLLASVEVISATLIGLCESCPALYACVKERDPIHVSKGDVDLCGPCSRLHAVHHYLHVVDYNSSIHYLS